MVQKLLSVPENGETEIMLRQLIGLFAIIGATCLSASGDASASLISTTVSGDLKFEYLGGEAGPSIQEFGIGTPSTGSLASDRNAVFIIDYYQPRTSLPIINKGYFWQGSQLDFYNLSSYNGNLFAFSSGLSTSPTLADRAAFSDTDNSLNLGGSVVEQIGGNAWILHLDDAWSYLYDDDDNELIIKIWIDPTATPPSKVPEPSVALLLAIGLTCLGLQLRSGAHTNNRGPG